MVPVPGSVGDSGFRRESQKNVQGTSNIGSRIDDDAAEPKSPDQQSVRMNSADGREGDLDPDPDLEDKPLSPQVPAGTPADLNASRYPSTKQGKVKAERFRFVGSQVVPPQYPPKDHPISRSEKKKPKKKLTQIKMKDPDVDDEDQSGSKLRSRSGQGWSDEDLENCSIAKNSVPAARSCDADLEAKTDWGPKRTRSSPNQEHQ
ncbi:Hypothetical protein PHPALM_11587 [Phytophthora palmivora]|uniref:Uncharacterized protein n=1 Tax=Phytophthora palmivora TaxID=4796 RepID=A0A2P4Y247_9STRA|nr:Hypothetical protein PHPALM_11587 [Phytophthora palmivora]